MPFLKSLGSTNHCDENLSIQGLSNKNNIVNARVILHCTLHCYLKSTESEPMQCLMYCNFRWVWDVNCCINKRWFMFYQLMLQIVMGCVSTMTQFWTKEIFIFKLIMVGDRKWQKWFCFFNANCNGADFKIFIVNFSHNLLTIFCWTVP